MPGRLDSLVLTMALLLLSLSVAVAQTPVPVEFVSAKPAFAKLALTADDQKVLLLAGDESGGTGTGYDTIYADTNFNSVIEAAEKVTRDGNAEYDPYKPLSFDFGYNAKSAGVKEPLVVTLTKSYMGSGFAVSMRVRLRQDNQDWEYTFRQPLKLVTDLQKAPVLAPRPLTVNLQTRPGNGLGIAATLSAGDFSISCYPPQGSPLVRLRVLNADDQTVSDTTVPLDRLGFG
ncbi:MAG: hypothetical protein KKI08_24710 [Armatimonadetes bacterium]|nr:hypothetical protein [Armatimonadota bacterium]